MDPGLIAFRHVIRVSGIYSESLISFPETNVCHVMAFQRF
jgi:hypothetical protein